MSEPLLFSRAQAFATGCGLALLQVALGFSVLRSVGASAPVWGALLLSWLLGAFVGVLWRRAQQRQGALLAAALFALGLCEVATAVAPFRAWPLLLALVAGGLAGGYGGAFLASRAARGADLGPLFFHENNGFLFGFVAASVVVLLAAPLLPVLAALVALGAHCLRGNSLARPGVQALLIGALAAVLQLALLWSGDPGWDALMTASVLAHPELVSAREILFFAHPLVIPLTWPFTRFTDDPLSAAAAREAVCSGGVVALAYLGGRAAGASCRWPSLVGAVAALGLGLAVGRWRLAAAGEEKEVALFAGGAFLFLYLDHRGLWELGLSSWRALLARQRRLLLGGLLALAAAIHLVNGVLALWVILDCALSRKRRAVAAEAAWVLVVAAALAGPLFIWLAVGPGGARSAAEVARFYLEYHLSGEFLSAPDSLGLRAVEAYQGARTWLLGELPSFRPPAEALLCACAVSALSLRALLVAPRLSARLLLFIGLLAAHFFFYEPWHPEAWGPVALAWSVVLALGLLAPGRGLWARLGLAALGIALLVGLQVRGRVQARREALAVQNFVGAATPAAAPLRDLVRWLDATLERDAIVVVSDRLLASYFLIYTSRRAVVWDYLDQTPYALRTRFRLTTLSLRFYQPAWTEESLRQAAQDGRPVYLLGNAQNKNQDPEADPEAKADPEAEAEPAQALPWRGLQLSRLPL